MPRLEVLRNPKFPSPHLGRPPIRGVLEVPATITRTPSTITLDPQTLCRLWDQHHDKLVLIMRAMGGAVAESSAEDAAQEAFVELAELNQLPDDPLAWLVRVARNRILSWHRSGDRRRTRERDRPMECWFQPADETVSGEELTKALRQLPDEHRQIIVMHHWGEMTFQQIAGTLQLSKSSVHRSYQEGLAVLRRTFEPQIDKTQRFTHATDT